jgi:hypothetical protein
MKIVMRIAMSEKIAMSSDVSVFTPSSGVLKTRMSCRRALEKDPGHVGASRCHTATWKREFKLPWRKAGLLKSTL